MGDKPSFQVIVLGPHGGPREDRVTGLLVRSASMKWLPGSVVAVDAGTLLAGIIRELSRYIPGSKDDQGVMTQGPFKGLELPHETAEANAAHFFREIIGAVLITHPHLDHISGLAINTPILEAGSGPKPVGALPSVITAIKNHMFNDVIWPNLSDEDGGAGLLTYQRLVEGGNPRFGSGEGRGYVRACNGLLTKCLSVSHGRCKQRFHPDSGTHPRMGSTIFGDQLMLPSRAISVDHTDGSFYSPARSPRLLPNNTKEPIMTTVESSAFFLRDYRIGNEIIVFGDVEPDSVSLEPHNRRVWETAAPKVAAGTLRGIFIECSYDDSIDDAYLYGHLCPRHLIAELIVLASKVMEVRDSALDRKRKREDAVAQSEAGADISPRSKRNTSTPGERDRKPSAYPYGAQMTPGEVMNLPEMPKEQQPVPFSASPVQLGPLETMNPSRWADADPLPLAGLTVYIIHIKDCLTDGPAPGERILRELRAHGEGAHLGCEFVIPDHPAEGIWI